MEEISQTPEIASFDAVTVAADFIVSVYPNMILRKGTIYRVQILLSNSFERYI